MTYDSVPKLFGQTAGIELSKGAAFEQARQNLRMLLNALVSLRMSDYRRNPGVEHLEDGHFDIGRDHLEGEFEKEV